ncbi:MAG TPA: amino acid permease [Blastocatellia bacterium]|nr:amino acid permease [Blastocatellia bacterium]
MAESNNQVVRALGLTDSSALVVGKVIGTGVFLKAAVMMQQVHTPLLMLAAWVAAGLLSLAGTLAYAELAAMFPQAGGEYVYLRAAYGKAPAFLYGWMQIVVGQAGVIAALGIACATFASALLPLNAVWLHHSFHLFGREVAWRFGLQQVVALGLILSFAAINCAGVALGGRAQSVLTAAKLLGIGLIVVGAFFFSGSGAWSNLTSASEGSHWSGFGPFGAAMLAALWAYNGWANLPMAAGEVRDPGRNMPRALIGGMLVVIAVYVLVNLAYVYALPLVEVLTSNSTAHSDALPVATKAARTFLGSAGEKFISVAFVISGLGSLNAGILTAARVPFAMSRDGLFFSKAANLGPRSHAPVWAIIIQAGWACMLALSGTFDQLTDLAVFSLWMFFGLTAASVFVLRRKIPEAARPYRTIGYPILPGIFVACAAWLVINTLYTNPWGSCAGLLLISLGLPFYLYFSHESTRMDTNRRNGSGNV